MKANRKIGMASGQSLIEVLVAVGLLSVVIGGIIATSIQVNKMAAHASSIQSFQAVANQLSSFISNEALCRRALGGPILKGSGSPNTQVFVSGTAYKIYQPDTSGAPLVAYLTSTPAATVIGPWTLKSLTITALNAAVVPPIVPAKMQLTMSRKLDGGGTETRVSQDLYLTLQLQPATNKIVSCSSLTFGTDVSPLPNCPAAGPTVMVSTDGIKLSCQFVSCPGGQRIYYAGSNSYCN